jgi:hypothetical protein
MLDLCMRHLCMLDLCMRHLCMPGEWWRERGKIWRESGGGKIMADVSPMYETFMYSRNIYT